jgi:hypothetical protein
MNKFRKRKHKKLKGSTEIRQGFDLAKVVATGLVVFIMIVAIGNYALSMMKSTGVGNVTIYNQGLSMLNTLVSGFGNVVNIVVLAILIIVLGVVVVIVERW